MQQKRDHEIREVELAPGTRARVEIRSDRSAFRGRLAGKPRAPEFSGSTIDDVLAALKRAFRDSSPAPGKHFR